MSQQTTAVRAFPRLAQVPRWMFRDQRAVLLLTGTVLIGDLMLITGNIAARFLGSSNGMWALNDDRGYAEIYQYIKFLNILVLIALCAVTRRAWQIGLWLLLFGYFLIDDALRVHERAGFRLIDLLGLQTTLGIRPQDLGELLVSATAAIAVGLPLLIGYVWGTEVSRGVYRVFIVLAFLLAVVGIGLDLLHMMILDLAAAFDWMVIAEDGGELLVVTLILGFALRLNISGGEPGLPARSGASPVLGRGSGFGETVSAHSVSPNPDL